jgi:hypothetical protein
VLLDEHFWMAVPAENVLIFQTGVGACCAAFSLGNGAAAAARAFAGGVRSCLCCCCWCMCSSPLLLLLLCVEAAYRTINSLVRLVRHPSASSMRADAVLCRPGIENYLHYDYVGAPWYLCDSMCVATWLCCWRPLVVVAGCCGWCRGGVCLTGLSIHLLVHASESRPARLLSARQAVSQFVRPSVSQSVSLTVVIMSVCCLCIRQSVSEPVPVSHRSPCVSCRHGGKKGTSYLCEAGNGGLSLRKKSVQLRQIRTQLRSLVMEDYQASCAAVVAAAAGCCCRCCCCCCCCCCCVLPLLLLLCVCGGAGCCCGRHCRCFGAALSGRDQLPAIPLFGKLATVVDTDGGAAVRFVSAAALKRECVVVADVRVAVSDAAWCFRVAAPPA